FVPLWQVGELDAIGAIPADIQGVATIGTGRGAPAHNPIAVIGGDGYPGHTGFIRTVIDAIAVEVTEDIATNRSRWGQRRWVGLAYHNHLRGGIECGPANARSMLGDGVGPTGNALEDQGTALIYRGSGNEAIRPLNGHGEGTTAGTTDGLGDREDACPRWHSPNEDIFVVVVIFIIVAGIVRVVVVHHIIVGWCSIPW